MDGYILNIADLHVSVGDKEIIKGIDLSIKEGEVHLLFGPNGSGKSTLLNAIMHLPGYTITKGSVQIRESDTAEMSTDAIANLGVGMSFQHPPKIKGVRLRRFLETIDRTGDLQTGIDNLKMESLMERELNVGFSGGELKRAEILKLYAQSPELLLIDEPESGVDIENITVISDAINKLLSKTPTVSGAKRSALIITHTGTFLHTIHADIGHVFMDGKIVCTGNPVEIMDDIRRYGFSGCTDCINRREAARDSL
jgi:Fe-S cluster assembly ATP-binding protein